MAPFFVKQILKDLRLKGIEFPGLEFQPFDLPLGADEVRTFQSWTDSGPEWTQGEVWTRDGRGAGSILHPAYD